ncbi:putative NBD/HSP70 family sugar kinase [Kineothrix alysoides]|uniref:Putative NBD/HSP70 family sugar kinase n=1 Tax=Kineothrix alysoides TaxID=1469948 RepID=A0A4R1QMA9_9FIRM|nr:ROK family protein [Kineothrix alysoides]TCL54858.1 putative NBD/HSP70 family sugar kinase [Kineothrix alysoides]
MDTYLGLDFGGTKLLIGELDEEGHVLRSKRYDTRLSEQKEVAEAILNDLTDYIKAMGIQGNLKAAGLGIVGIVDNKRGEWVSMNHEITGPPVPIAAMIADKLGVPCAVDNDVRSATAAELILGQGRTSSDFIYLNVGTGLAAGFVCGGRIMRGANCNAGEIGHMVVDLSRKESCVCGREGCVENVVSGIGFTRQITSYGLPELLNAGKRADVVRLFQGADAGLKECVEITEYAAEALACVIMNLVRASDPDTVILGGGVISDGWLMEKVNRYLSPETMRGVTGGVIFSSFDLRYAGLIGAATLGMLLIKGGNR